MHTVLRVTIFVSVVLVFLPFPSALSIQRGDTAFQKPLENDDTDTTTLEFDSGTIVYVYAPKYVDRL